MLEGDTITAVRYFDWPTPHTRTEVFTKHPLGAGYDCATGYDCAADGECFGISSNLPDGSCLASVQDALQKAGYSNVYVIWAQKNRTPASLRRWAMKWGRRTAKTADLNRYPLS